MNRLAVRALVLVIDTAARPGFIGIGICVSAINQLERAAAHIDGAQGHTVEFIGSEESRDAMAKDSKASKKRPRR